MGRLTPDDKLAISSDGPKFKGEHKIIAGLEEALSFTKGQPSRARVTVIKVESEHGR